MKTVLGLVGLVLLTLLVLILAAIAGPNAVALGLIKAEATIEGISISGVPSEMECVSDGGQAVAPMGFTPWDHEVVWGSVVEVWCAYPGTTGFWHAFAMVRGWVFMPLVRGGRNDQGG